MMFAASDATVSASALVAVAVFGFAGVIVASIIGPLLTSRQLVRQEAARIAAAEKVAKLQADATAAQSKLLTGIDRQGKENHKLLNSAMTARWSSELDTTKLTRVLLRRLFDRDVADGHTPSDDDVALMATVNGRISELEETVAAREAQAETLDGSTT